MLWLCSLVYFIWSITVDIFPPNYCAVPRVLDCGCCLIGGVKFVEFLCQNVGLSAGNFCIVPKNQWPASNLRVNIYLTLLICFFFCYKKGNLHVPLFFFLHIVFGKNLLF